MLRHNKKRHIRSPIIMLQKISKKNYASSQLQSVYFPHHIIHLFQMQCFFFINIVLTQTIRNVKIILNINEIKGIL